MLLAKPDVSLIHHTTDVVRLGNEIARRLGIQEPWRTKALLACAMHDIGKATADFQEYIRGMRKIAYPHALASLPFVLLAEARLNQCIGMEPTRLEATAAVLTHHSPLSPGLYRGYPAPPYLEEDIFRLLPTLWELLNALQAHGLPTVEELQQSLRIILRNSPAALLDDPHLRFGDHGNTLRGVLQRLPAQEFAQVKTVLHLADWLVSAGKPMPDLLFLTGGRSEPTRRIERQLKAPLRLFQQQAREAGNAPVLWLRAPTGTGKTEALLLWAGDTERILYLLPTQATTNAMWRRLRKIYGKKAVGLSHGRAAYILHREAEEGHLDLRLLGSVFAQPVTVATLDQYLLAHLNGQHWEERRVLARKATMILDEIHVYEPYTLGLLLEALERERPARLALASATLPDALLRFFPPGQFVEAERELWERRRYRLELQDGSLLEDGVEQALAFARQGKRVLVVANTVRDAQMFYKRIRESGWRKQELLHARWILRDRQKKERRAEKSRPGVIFIATQIVEVSLDISYDALITEAAPIDALVQRMGRVNRRGEQPPAPVRVYSRWSEGAQRIYGRELLEWSVEILRSMPSEPADSDLTRATCQLYERVVTTPEWQQELQQGRQALDEIQRTLGCYTIDLSDEEMRRRFTARRGTVSVEVLPDRFLQEAYRLTEQKESWRLPELLVPVPIWWLKEFANHFSPVSDLGVVQTTLAYDDELGLVAESAEMERII